MRVRAFLIYIYFVIYPFCVLSQQLVVQSGAHQDFSRLVIPNPSSSDWVISREKNRIRVDLLDHTQGFNVSSIFNFIDRRHILSVEGDRAGLNIDVGCVCDYASFVEKDTFVVIDIYEVSSDLARRQYVVNTGVREDGLKFSTEPTKDYSWKGYLGIDGFPISSLKTAAYSRRQQNEIEHDTGSSLRGISELDREDNDSIETSDILYFQRELETSFSNALEGGILNDVGQKSESNDFPLGESSNITDLRPSDVGLDHNRADPDGYPNIRITTSRTIHNGNLEQREGATQVNKLCAQQSFMELYEWGGEQSIDRAFSVYRSKLFQETGRVDEYVGFNLAKSYLYFGFGAELRHLLLIASRLSENHPELHEIAHILEHGYPKNRDILGKYISCTGPIALWAVLAAENGELLSEPIIDAALRSFSASPPHIRQLISSQLAKKLFEYRGLTSATPAVRSRDRVTPLGSDDRISALTLGEFEIMSKDQLASHLKKPTTSRSEYAEYLVSLIDYRFSENGEIDAALASLVESYAVEFRDSNLARKLYRAKIISLAKSGQFDRAFAAVKKHSETNNDGQENDVNMLLFDILAEDSDDVSFLFFVSEQAKLSQTLFSPSTGLSISERLLDLGFPAFARQILQSSHRSLSPSQREARLRARVALRLGQPVQAEMFVKGLVGPDVEEIRAQAKEAQNQFYEAGELYRSVGNEEAELQAAWRAEDWGRIANANANIYAPIASLVNSDVDVADARNGLLGRLDDALSESAQARGIIQQLLEHDFSSALPDR